MNIDQLVAVVEKLNQPPSVTPLLTAAQRAAARANQDFQAARVPVRAVVAPTPKGARLQLKQIGPLTRPFGDTTPVDIARQRLAAELPGAATELVDKIIGSLT